MDHDEGFDKRRTIFVNQFYYNRELVIFTLAILTGAVVVFSFFRVTWTFLSRFRCYHVFNFTHVV